MSMPKARDFMASELTVLTPDMEINRAIHLLLDRQVSGAPVINSAQQLVGVLSSKDCLKAVLHASYFQQLGSTVADYMSRDVETLEPGLDLVEVAQHFLSSDFRRFPVVDDGKLVGQISRADVLRALLDSWKE